MNPARFAKVMLRRPGVELIGRERLPSREKLEVSGFDDKMQEAFLGAHAAIAFAHARQVGGDAKAHFAAMTAALEGSHATVLHELSFFAKPRDEGRRGRRAQPSQRGCAEHFFGSDGLDPLPRSRRPWRVNADPMRLQRKQLKDL